MTTSYKSPLRLLLRPAADVASSLPNLYSALSSFVVPPRYTRSHPASHGPNHRWVHVLPSLPAEAENRDSAVMSSNGKHSLVLILPLQESHSLRSRVPPGVYDYDRRLDTVNHAVVNLC